ncbi:Uncharacterized protein SCF082_LOCUS20946 [Durusdinium trenchii]|uniref:Uncharacterized protein n=1 Tax=Durusdinium trenchii TaxID=1381693 RepID=A0ABP0L759_9DINO
MVGVHPRNRDGVGVAVREVHSLLADILDTGFVPSLVSALAFEVTGPEELEFNRKLIEPAGGQLGVADVAQMRYLSVCGSHTNFVLRLFVDSVEHSQNQQEGVVWEIIPSWIALQFPRLPEILQQVGNTSLNRGESEMQMLQRLHSMCVERTSKGERVNLEDVKRRALASKPAFAESLSDMWTFVMRYSGGAKANMMQETQQFVMTNTKSTQLGAPLWKALVEESKIATNPLVRWRHAILKQGYFHGVKALDVKRSFSKDMVRRVAEANDLMLEVEDRCISVVSLWEHVHGFMYKVAENPVVVEVQCLRESVPYSRVESDAIVLVPERALRV